MTEKHFITAENLLDDSFKLGLQVFESGFKPDYIVGVWRGGAPIGIAVQELLEFVGVPSDHIAIRTSSYSGIQERNAHVNVHGLSYIITRARAKHSVLIVDDVFDTGLSVQQIILNMQCECGDNMPILKIATPYFKPSNNKTDRAPDFYLHETNQWLVFPHELQGLSRKEIEQHKPGITAIKSLLSQHGLYHD